MHTALSVMLVGIILMGVIVMASSISSFEIPALVAGDI